MDNPDRWEKHDHEGMARLARNGKFRLLAEYSDLDLKAFDALVRAKTVDAAASTHSTNKGDAHHAG